MKSRIFTGRLQTTNGRGDTEFLTVHCPHFMQGVVAPAHLMTLDNPLLPPHECSTDCALLEVLLKAGKHYALLHCGNNSAEYALESIS